MKFACVNTFVRGRAGCAHETGPASHQTQVAFVRPPTTPHVFAAKPPPPARRFAVEQEPPTRNTFSRRQGVGPLLSRGAFPCCSTKRGKEYRNGSDYSSVHMASGGEIYLPALARIPPPRSKRNLHGYVVLCPRSCRTRPTIKEYGAARPVATHEKLSHQIPTLSNTTPPDGVYSLA